MMENSIKKSKILIADDEYINRILLKKIFDKDFEVLEASDGLEVVEIIKNHDIIALLLDIVMPNFDGYQVLEYIKKDAKLSEIPVIVITGNDDLENQIKVLDLGASDIVAKPFNPQIVKKRVNNLIQRRELFDTAKEKALLEKDLVQKQKLLRLSEIDEKTGIYSRQAFNYFAREKLNKNKKAEYTIMVLDIDHFQIYNDMFGTAAGDKLLFDIGQRMKEINSNNLYAHLEADRFVFLFEKKYINVEKIYKEIKEWFNSYRSDFEFIPRIGLYHIDDPKLEISLMCDRALMALKSTKKSFSTRFAYYDQSMRSVLLEEQEIIADMATALKENQFIIYLQPQYDYSTNKMFGAEALIRWQHPKKGLISPAKFIPIFERNGLITVLDEYVWEQACILISKLKGMGIPLVPISVNISRHDFYNPHLCEKLCNLIKKYNLKHKQLHLEITESAYMDNPNQLISIVEKLRNHGFFLEMDDFGSGYSSLNTLKDVPVDLLKLDMKFISQATENTKGGSILSSVIRMAHWLKLPVIAEGIEKREQADFLKTMGCSLMQGYLFCKPIPVDEFIEKISSESASNNIANSRHQGLQGSADFLNGSVQATLLFNSFVGGSQIIEYDGSNVEVLRMNDKCLDVFQTTREEYAQYELHALDKYDDESKKKYINMLEEASLTGEESSCEVHTKVLSKSNETNWFYIRARYLVSNMKRRIYYVSVENITNRIKLIEQNQKLSNELYAVMDSVPGGIIIFACDKDAIVKIEYFNNSVPKMFGFDKSEYKKQAAKDPFYFVAKEDREGVKRAILAGITNPKKTQTYKYNHLCKDGSYKWVQLTGKVIEEVNGIYRASTILLDIDDSVNNEIILHEQENNLREQEKKIKNLFNSVPCAILQYSFEDANLKVINYNDTTWKMFGYESKALFNKYITDGTILQNVFPDDIEEVLNNFNSIYNGIKDEIQFDHRFYFPNGTLRWARVYLKKVMNDGKVLLQSIYLDITEQKKTELQQYSEVVINLFDEVLQYDSVKDCIKYERKKYQLPLEKDKEYTTDYYLDCWCEKYVLPEDVYNIRSFYDINEESIRVSRVAYRYKDENDKVCWMSTTRFHISDGIYLICNKDITDQQNIIAMQRENNTLQIQNEELNRYRLIFERTGSVIVDSNLENNTYYCSENFQKYALSKIDNSHVFDKKANKEMYYYKDKQVVDDYFKRIKDKETYIDLTARLKMVDGSYRWTKLENIIIYNKELKPIRSIITLIDIDNEIKLKLKDEWQNERYRLVSERNDSLIFDYSVDDDTMLISYLLPKEGMKEIVYEDFLKNFDSEDFKIHSDCKSAYKAFLMEAIEEKKEGIFEYKANYFNKEYKWYKTRYVSLKENNNKVYRVVGRIDDIDNEVIKIQELRQQAQRDAMTGLLNKETARETIVGYLSEKPENRVDALLFLDIDDFKEINDSFGHDVGDWAIKQVALAIKIVLGEDMMSARYGGDEFLMYLTSVSSLDNLNEIASDLLSEISKIEIKARKIHVSMGINIINGKKLSYDEIFKNADKALYKAKLSGKNCYKIYNE